MALPIIPWIGGKRRLAELLLSRFPAHTCYVEVFAGGAAVFFMRSPAQVEVINDVSLDLVNLYRVVSHHPEEFMRQFKYALSSRQVFEWHKASVPETLTDIQRAARFYYLQQHAFGGRVAGQSYGTATTGSTPNLFRIEESLSAAHLRLSGVNIENLGWEACMDRYDRAHTLFYCDPPYWQTEGYGLPFAWDNYERLAAKMAAVKGKVVVSLNDHPDIRRCFSAFEMETLEIEYTVGGGGKAVTRKEVIIYSWPISEQPAGLF